MSTVVEGKLWQWRSVWLLPAGLGILGVVLGLLLAKLPLTVLGLGLGGCLLLIGIYIEPLLGVGAALCLGLLRAWLEIRSPGIAPHVGQVILVLSLAAWVAASMIRRDLHLSVPASLLPLFVLIGAVLLSLWAPVDTWNGALELLKWGQIALVAVLVYDRVASRRRLRLDTRWVVAALAVPALVQAVVGLWQFGLLRLGSLTPIEIPQFAISARFSRAYGSFQQPNPYGGYLGMSGALLVGLTLSLFIDGWRVKKWRAKALPAALASAAWWAISAVVVVAGLVASWSRGGWMGFAAAMLVVVALLPRRGWWGLVLCVGVLGVGGLLFAIGQLPAALAERLVGFLAYTRFEDVRGVGITDANYSVLERMAHWQAALGMWRDHFWVGVGLGGYEAAYPAYRFMNWIPALGHAHNAYLNALAETGVIGLCAYLGWLGYTGLSLIRVVINRRKPATPWRRGVALGLLGAWTHFAMHSLVDNLLVNNVHLHIGVLVALSAWVIGCDWDRPSEAISPADATT